MRIIVGHNYFLLNLSLNSILNWICKAVYTNFSANDRPSISSITESAENLVPKRERPKDWLSNSFILILWLKSLMDKKLSLHEYIFMILWKLTLLQNCFRIFLRLLFIISGSSRVFTYLAPKMFFVSKL